VDYGLILEWQKPPGLALWFDEWTTSVRSFNHQPVTLFSNVSMITTILLFVVQLGSKKEENPKGGRE
jgi:hypothetical protein